MEHDILNRIDKVGVVVKQHVSDEIDNTITGDTHILKGLITMCINCYCDLAQQEVRAVFREGEK